MADDKIIIKKSGPVSLNSGIELPIDGLPISIQQYINAVCDIYHCPREFVTSAVLSTASTAVGKKIKINEGKYKNSLVLWFVLVARSGSNKSYPMKLVTQPLRKIDEELYADYKKKHDAWKAIPNKERNEDEPRCPSIVLDDCTDERRSEILFINNDTDAEANENSGSYGAKRGAIGIYPELKGMFDSRNQYQNGGTAAISKLLRLFGRMVINLCNQNKNLTFAYKQTAMEKNPYIELAECLLPEEMVEYFEVVKVEKTRETLDVTLEERDNGIDGYKNGQLRPNGFYEESVVRDYPVRGRKMSFHVKRRRWIDTTTGKSVSRQWDLVAEGTRFSKEFAAFLKGMLGQIPDYGPLS